MRVGGTLIWATRFEEAKTTRGKAARAAARKQSTEYSYFANAAFALAEGPIAGVRRIWADGRELDRDTVEIRVHAGGEGQLADPLIAASGQGSTPAYRGTAYAVVERMPIGAYGNRIPQLQFEVMRPVGTVATALQAVALIPGSTEHGLAPDLVTREAHAGRRPSAVNRHMLHAATDLAASLDELQALCPRLRRVALVVSWFGDDLRAGRCRIRPAVMQRAAGSLSESWAAAGLDQATAPLVSRSGGAPAYGGSPSDRSVIAAIRALKARGLEVTLYPFVMLDVPADNALPDPYGATRQAAYPWRGRITCHPAPGRPGSPDRSAAARVEANAFLGQARAADFVTGAADGEGFRGNPEDWGYRRFVLHLAALAAAAGGVDAMLIGSELVGLTTLSDEANRYPFVEGLAALAAECRALLGPATKLTYGADWSEYFGHHRQDGSGDVRFHLDPLWAHPAIDAVGIDCYMPLSDWRDEDYGGGNPDGFAGPYDPAGLERGIAGGEGFDWHYPSPSARAARQRAAILDGACGKPWVFRCKDLVGWWSNPHHDRVGGREVGQPTAWVPRSKPIWLTELGCPAVDKGPNQPNVFPDPKSAEGGQPYFSTGGRSDLAMERFLAAHLSHWDDTAAGFSEQANPVSPLYGGRMVDASRLYAWAWDARPYPAFPLDAASWRDGDNWRLGHWLNGRLSGIEVGALINAILADHGLRPVAQADGTVQGYLIADPGPVRAALEPIVDLFGLVAGERDGVVTFAREGWQAAAAAEVFELAAEEGQPVLEVVRSADEAPGEATLTFRDPLAAYQSATVHLRRSGGGGHAQETIGFPGALDREQAAALLEDWLERRAVRRQTVRFALAAPDARVEPGALIRLPEHFGGLEFVVTEIEDGLVRRVVARQTARMAPAQVTAGLAATVSAPATAIAGRPLALFLDLPLLPGVRAPEGCFRLALWNCHWSPQRALVSPERSGFAERAEIVERATVGRLTTPLAAGREGLIDRHRALRVRLFSGELQSVGDPQLMNGANLAAVRSASGAWEVLQFGSAEETAPSVWSLSRLLRGQLGSGDAMLAGAPRARSSCSSTAPSSPRGCAPTSAG